MCAALSNLSNLCVFCLKCSDASSEQKWVFQSEGEEQTGSGRNVSARQRKEVASNIY